VLGVSLLQSIRDVRLHLLPQVLELVSHLVPSLLELAVHDLLVLADADVLSLNACGEGVSELLALAPEPFRLGELLPL
jgi:hypothetical protein